jgi:hypothetical protein
MSWRGRSRAVDGTPAIATAARSGLIGEGGRRASRKVGIRFDFCQIHRGENQSERRNVSVLLARIAATYQSLRSLPRRRPKTSPRQSIRRKVAQHDLRWLSLWECHLSTLPVLPPRTPLVPNFLSLRPVCSQRSLASPASISFCFIRLLSREPGASPALPSISAGSAPHASHITRRSDRHAPPGPGGRLPRLSHGLPEQRCGLPS